MVSEIKARIQVHGKDNTQELIKEITDTLWSYNDVRKCVNNNYIILQSIVRNTVKSQVLMRTTLILRLLMTILTFMNLIRNRRTR